MGAAVVAHPRTSQGAPFRMAECARAWDFIAAAGRSRDRHTMAETAMRPLPENLVQQSCERGGPSVTTGGPEVWQSLLELGGRIENAATSSATVVRGERDGRLWSVEVYADEASAELRRLALEPSARAARRRLMRSRIRVRSVLLREEDERLLCRLMEQRGQDAAAVMAAGLHALRGGADAAS
jgi:hypothetical protein